MLTRFIPGDHSSGRSYFDCDQKIFAFEFYPICNFIFIWNGHDRCPNEQSREVEVSSAAPF